MRSATGIILSKPSTRELADGDVDSRFQPPADQAIGRGAVNRLQFPPHAPLSSKVDVEVKEWAVHWGWNDGTTRPGDFKKLAPRKYEERQ